MLTIPQHRTLQPSGPPGPQSSAAQRVDAALDSLRHEFDVLHGEMQVLRPQRDEYEAKSMFLYLKYNNSVRI